MRASSFAIAVALLAGIQTVALAIDPIDSGALDPTFGSGGRVQMRAFASGGGGPTQFVAYDTAIQANGKIVLVGGYADGGNDAGWMVSQLNADGSLDTTFQGGAGTFSQPGYYFPFFSSNTEAQARAVALRPDGRIVVAGSVINGGTLTGALIQLNADGTPDFTWRNGSGYVFLFGTNSPSDALRFRRIVLSSAGDALIVGSYTHGSNGNSDFYFADIPAAGLSGTAIIPELGLGGAYFDGATDIAIDSHGDYIVSGYASSAGGDVDCIAVRIRAGASSIDPSFGNNGVARVAFNKGGDNNDYCDSMTLEPGDQIVLGGHGTQNAGSGTYQAAIVALLDNNGALEGYYSSGIGPYPDKYDFDYRNGSLLVNNGNTVNKLLAQPYDGKTLAMGYHYDAHLGPFTGDDFAIARLDRPIFTNFSNDSFFNGGGSDLLDFGSYHFGNYNFVSNDRVQSAAFDRQGRLVVVGYSGDSAGGGDLAVVRFAPFDGIFKNRFETPSY